MGCCIVLIKTAMCKAIDRGMTHSGVRVLEKHAGKSASYVAG